MERLMKKPIKAKTATAKNQDLNRWCIELAMRWPVIHVPASYGGHAVAGLPGGIGYQQNIPARDVDADVIGRANRIMEWVKASH
jgi:hypothetical protein